MTYKVFQSKYNPNAWLVLVDWDEPGETLVSFTGKNAKELAEEYAAWKNNDKLWHPPVEWKAMETGRASSSKPNMTVVEAGVDPNHQTQRCDHCGHVFQPPDEVIQTSTHSSPVTLCRKCYNDAGSSVR